MTHFEGLEQSWASFDDATNPPLQPFSAALVTGNTIELDGHGFADGQAVTGA